MALVVEQTIIFATISNTWLNSQSSIWMKASWNVPLLNRVMDHVQAVYVMFWKFTSQACFLGKRCFFISWCLLRCKLLLLHFSGAITNLFWASQRMSLFPVVMETRESLLWQHVKGLLLRSLVDISDAPSKRTRYLLHSHDRIRAFLYVYCLLNQQRCARKLFVALARHHDAFKPTSGPDNAAITYIGFQTVAHCAIHTCF